MGTVGGGELHAHAFRVGGQALFGGCILMPSV